MFLMDGKVKNLLASDMFVMFFRLKYQVLSFVVINFLIPMLILFKIQEDNCCPAKCRCKVLGFSYGIVGVKVKLLCRLG